MFRRFFLLTLLILLVAAIPASTVAAFQVGTGVIMKDFTCATLNPGAVTVDEAGTITHIRDRSGLHRMTSEDGLVMWQTGNANRYVNSETGYISIWGTGVMSMDDINGGFNWRYIWRRDNADAAPIGHTIGHGWGDYAGQIWRGEHTEYTAEPTPAECGGNDTAGLWMMYDVTDTVMEEMPSQLEFLTLATNEGMMDDLEAYIHPDFAWYSNGSPTFEGVDGFKTSISTWRELFPDWLTTTTEVFTGDNMFIVHGNITGTYTGTSDMFSTLEATGNQINSPCALYVYLEDDKVKEVHAFFGDGLWNTIVG